MGGFMVRRTKIILAVSSLAILLALLFVADRNIVRTGSSASGDREIYTEAQALANQVDLVVLATATGKSENITYREHGYPEGYTLSEIHIHEVLENENKIELPATLTIVEPTYLFRNGIELGLTRFTWGRYTPLVEGAKYILFLSWNERRGVYAIYSSDQGKVNVDGKDTNEMQAISEVDHLDILHRSVMSFYLK